MSQSVWIQQRLFILIFVGVMTAITSACGGNDSSRSTDTDVEGDGVELTTDLIFDNITLEQSDDQGVLRWRMIADRAVYSQDRRDATVERPSGDIFQRDGEGNQHSYSVEADLGEVKQDGEQLFLKGNVIVTDEETGAVIRGNEMRWIPNSNTIVLRGNVSTDHPDFKMTAQRVTVWVDEDKVEVKGKVKAETADATLQFNGEEVVWLLAEEQVMSDRPVRFQQIEDDAVVGRAQGNQVTYDISTQLATLTNDAVVVLQDPPIKVTGNVLEWSQNDNIVNAPERVTVFNRKEKVTAVGDTAQGDLETQIFQMDGNVIVTAERNQARLRSDELTWTVSDQRIVAEGNVLYRQTDPVFNLKGPRAVGRLEDETIVVSGGRVVTEVIPDS
ncbi:MAG: LPS export ABC transporter periplasmic protein LptC [Symploca sp. SIO2B6]|nr:LPS export ABC transporter periplasmic protein LptC [Symploca sp. SIO2B6]